MAEIDFIKYIGHMLDSMIWRIFYSVNLCDLAAAEITYIREELNKRVQYVNIGKWIPNIAVDEDQFGKVPVVDTDYNARSNSECVTQMMNLLRDIWRRGVAHITA